MADQDPRKRDVQKHLEFLGDTCEWQPDDPVEEIEESEETKAAPVSVN